ISTNTPVDFDDDDDDDDGADDEGEQGEETLVLALRKSDRYPLLPKFDSNTPLEHLKHLLRVYVGHVRSESSPLFSNPVILQKSNPEFKNLFGRRIPLTSIQATNGVHFVSKSQPNHFLSKTPPR